MTAENNLCCKNVTHKLYQLEATLYDDPYFHTNARYILWKITSTKLHAVKQQDDLNKMSAFSYTYKNTQNSYG